MNTKLDTGTDSLGVLGYQVMIATVHIFYQVGYQYTKIFPPKKDMFVASSEQHTER